MKTKSSKGLKEKTRRGDVSATTNLKPKQIRIESATNELGVNISIKQEDTDIKLEKDDMQYMEDNRQNNFNNTCTNVTNKIVDKSNKDKAAQFNCLSCDSVFASVSSYSIHMCQSHNTLTSPYISKRDKDVLPDPTNPNNYCRPCKRAYRTQAYYRNHLLYSHQLRCLPYKNSIQQSSEILCQIKENEMERFCYSCQETFQSNSIYEQHFCSSHHVIVLIKKTLKFANIPDPTDPNQYCRVCKKSFDGDIEYWKHLHETHMLDLPSLSESRELFIAAIALSSSNKNKDDEANFCYKCNERYTSRKCYISHLTLKHKVYMRESTQIHIKALQPDPNDPNFYCRSCDTQYITIGQYRVHLRQAPHFMNLSPIQLKGRRRWTPYDNNPDKKDESDTYCTPCDMNYSSPQQLRQHLRRIHKIFVEPRRGKPDFAIEPDPNDPDFYCKSCKFKFLHLTSYKSHLKKIHNMSACTRSRKKSSSIDKHIQLEHEMEGSQSIKDEKQQPDPDDPNFHCKTCNTHYKSRSRYREHLRYVHKMNLPSLFKNAYSDAEPDPNDPNFYCASCSTAYPSLGRFRVHLRGVHKMNLKPLKGKLNPFIEEPDPNDSTLTANLATLNTVHL